MVQLVGYQKLAQHALLSAHNVAELVRLRGQSADKLADAIIAVRFLGSNEANTHFKLDARDQVYALEQSEWPELRHCALKHVRRPEIKTAIVHRYKCTLGAFLRREGYLSGAYSSRDARLIELAERAYDALVEDLEDGTVT